jgi:hypothetical protein
LVRMYTSNLKLKFLHWRKRGAALLRPPQKCRIQICWANQDLGLT